MCPERPCDCEGGPDDALPECAGPRSDQGTCRKCGEVYLNAKDSQRLDEVLERSYRALLTAVVREALRRLAEVVSKQELEIALGVSQGYLSKLPEKQTSPVLVNLLALLADNPERGLKIMQAVWTSGAAGSAE